MAEKKRLRMRGVKQTPKRLEEEILSRSKKLANDPSLLRPMCAGNCRKCIFDKTFKEINMFGKYKSDESVLLRLASRGGDDIVKAYAGTISLAAAGKIPLLATATLAGEKVPFAVRGQVGNDKLIGCQYYDDPKIRLLLYNNIIKKNKLHLYSFNSGLVCSDSPNMPEDYLYEAFWDTPYEFKNDGLMCGHEGALALSIKIKSLNDKICICENCAKEIPTIQFLISKICAIDPMDDVEINVTHSYHMEGQNGEEKIEGETLTKYIRGELNDKTLLQKIKNEKLENLRSSEKATYIIGTKNYGSSFVDMIKDLSGTDKEKDTLRRFLEVNPRSIVIKNGKTSEAFISLWNNDWRKLIATHTSDKIASKYKERPKSSYDIILEEAYNEYISADVVASLPIFNKPKPMTRLADTLAKAAKVDGVCFVIKTLENETLKNSKERSLAIAFVLACDPDTKAPINVSKEEMEFTKFLVPFAKMVIDANGDKYRDSMNILLTACGSGESV